MEVPANCAVTALSTTAATIRLLYRPASTVVLPPKHTCTNFANLQALRGYVPGSERIVRISDRQRVPAQPLNSAALSSSACESGLPADKIYLYFGRLSPEKGVMTFARHGAPAQHSAIIAGDGPESPP